MSLKRLPMVTKLKAKFRANPKINLVDMQIPLSNGSSTPKLKDVLEDNVGEKYYLRQELVEKIINEADFKERLVSVKIDKEEK